MDEPTGSEPADFKKARRSRTHLADPTKVDRLPPHDLQAEAAVLGCVLLSPDTIGLCIERLPGSEAFFDLKYRTVFETMLAMHTDGVAIDIITLRSELADLMQLEAVGGTAFLAGLPEATPSAANIEYYISILLEKFTLRRAIQTCTKVVSRAYEHQGEVDELVEQLTTDILAISQSTQKIASFHTSKELVVGSINRFEKSFENKGKLSGIGTGFVDLDILTNGLQDSEMYVVAARPSQGKSSFAMNIADHVAVNLTMPVLVFSLEMTAESLMDRAICSRAKVSLSDVRRGSIAERDFAKIATATSQLKKAPIFIDDACGTSIGKLMAKARRYHQQYGIRLLVLDYLQLITSKAENRRHEIAQVSNGIKALAKELKIPTIAVAQLNREVEKGKNRKPMMSDIRDAGEIEQDADFIGFLYQPKKSDDEPETYGDSIPVNLLVAKQRNGRTGDLPFVFMRSFTKFETASPVGDEDIPKSTPYSD